MIDDTIQYIEEELDKFKELNSNLKDLDTTGDVKVSGPYPLEIRIWQVNITDALLEVADMDIHTDRVEYIQEEDKNYYYRLEITITGLNSL